MFNPVQGDMILVRYKTWEPEPRVLVAIHKGQYLCEHSDNSELFRLWPEAKPLPAKPEPIPFTHETWPTQPVWVRLKGGSIEGLVTSRDKNRRMIYFGVSWIRYTTLADNCEMSIDYCQTWQPCQYVPESKE